MTYDDRTTLNASGAARRRLIKALGLGVVASQLTIDWRKPSVRFGALPAHAAPSVAVACTVSMDISIYPSDTGPITVQFEPNLYTTTVMSSSTSDSFSFEVAVSEHFDVSLAWTRATNTGAFAVFYEASCCTAVYDNSAPVFSGGPTSSSGYLLGALAGEPGECSFEQVCQDNP